MIVADEPRQQPVAIRVTRPYSSPEEFLEHELETLTRTSVTLIGAQPRPKGVILRFEVVFTGGGQLLRGEGRVVGYKENALADQPGLVLRFTRLDTKSKALVDRAAAIREARARAALQAAMGEDSSMPPVAPSSMSPGSLPPTSIGPMSVPNAPPSWEASGPPTRPHETPAFHRAGPSSDSSFDESTFADGSSPKLDSDPHVASSKPQPPSFTPPRVPSARPDPPPPAPPSSPTVADAPLARDIARPAPIEPFAMSPTAPPVMRPSAPARIEPPISSQPLPASSKPAIPSSKPSAGSVPSVSSQSAMPTSSKPALPSSRPAMPSSRPSLSREEREPLLSRLRERAQGLSPARLEALIRR